MAQYDISIDQHRTWSFYAIIKESDVAQDLTGYNFVFTVKKDASQKRPFIKRTLCRGNVSDGAFDPLPLGVGGASAGETGSIFITLSSIETAGLPPGKHLYDIYMTKPNGEVSTLLSGKCYVNRVIGE